VVSTGNLRVHVQVFARGIVMSASKIICGSIVKPKTGSVSRPVANFKIFPKVTCCLRPAAHINNEYVNLPILHGSQINSQLG